MARRNLFDNIKAPAGPSPERAAPAERPVATQYVARGATRNMLSSIGELAERAALAKDLVQGGTIVDLDPNLIDSSFVSDRMDDDDGYAEFLEGIKERGQDTPVLVRPHPSSPGRYQIVFGHRRTRAARDLARPVRAVIREISDAEHVIAQGQENSARTNLSFIERALFALRLQSQGHDRQTIQLALSVDNPMLTRLLSVSSRVPESVALSIGPARGVGRDRWTDLAQLMDAPENRSTADEITQAPNFAEMPSEQRFDHLVAELKLRAKKRRDGAAKPEKSKWQAADKSLSAEFMDTGRGYALAFKSKAGRDFGRYLAENLERFYDEFKQHDDATGKG